MKHIVRSQQFDRPVLEELFFATDEINRMYDTPEGKKELRKVCEGSLLFAVFYEPSTRTRVSFCSAAHHLGMTSIWTENAREFSSAIKGETLEDSIHTLCQYDPMVIVLRHNEIGAADRAVFIVDHSGYKVSIINAGDGIGHHPTQALLDLYTIKKEIGRTSDITVTIGGDLANGRTARSLVYLLAKFKGVKFIFISPLNLKIGEDITEHLKEHEVPFEEVTDIKQALVGTDVVYWTRIQKERGSTNSTLDLTIGPYEMKLMKEKAILLHPLPRVEEISKEVDDDKRAAYFRQARNGMFIRMALLKKLCS